MLLTVLNLLFTVFSLLFPLLVYVIFIQTLLYRPIIIAIDIVLLVLFFVVLKNKISERLKFILFALNISLCSLAFFAIGREVNEFTDSLIHLGYLTLISLSFILYLKIKNQISNRELKVFSLTFIVLIAANFLFSLNYASLNTLETIGGLNLDVSYENVSTDGSVPNTIDNRNLQNINFNNTLMINTHAKSANLSNADFSYSNFSFSDFTASNLSSANFNNATLLNCKFSEADLSGTTFNGANLKGAVFKSRENVVGVRIENVKFWGADLTKADFYGVQFENVDFSNAVLDSADFQQTDLTQTRSLTIDQLLKVKTLHHAMIDSTLGKRIFNINPELFISKEDIGDYTINDFKKDIIANYQPSQKIPDWVLINMVSGSLYGTDFEWISKLYINYYINSLIKEGFLKKADSTNYIRRK